MQLNPKQPQAYGRPKHYQNVHNLIKKKFGKPSKCEDCGTETAKKFEWASIGHVYTAEREDWKRLCTKCHIIMDGKYRSRPRKNTSSIYKGVRKYRDRWVASFWAKGENGHLGVYDTQEEAALSYNNKVISIGKGNAYLNPLTDETERMIEKKWLEETPKKQTSIFRGVNRGKSKIRPWRSSIKIKRKAYWLGSYDNEKSAAIAYDKAARKLKGSKAITNFQNGQED